MITYLVRNSDYIVAVKPPELCSEETEDGKGFCNILKAENEGFLAPVYRLDRGVGGVILYARNSETAGFFSELVRNHALRKTYSAILCGKPEKDEDELRDLLFYDRKKNKTFVVDRKRQGVKEAILTYRTIGTKSEDGKTRTLVKVNLMTGRTHQIRAQFASRYLPLLGDRRYGGEANPDGKNIALWCESMTTPNYKAYQSATLTSPAPFADFFAPD